MRVLFFLCVKEIGEEEKFLSGREVWYNKINTI